MARAASKTGSKSRSGSKSKSASNESSKAGTTSQSKVANEKTYGTNVQAARRKSTSPRNKPIELYYWPTPNGWKISIMLEECRLPYEVRPINISAGEQFKPEFLAISPNNRMPAIVDPNGPGGKPISVFESGAILQYLGRKTGKFYPTNERARVEVEQWLFWQMAGLGPMAGQAHHFRNYAPEQLDYPIKRYTNEVNRLYGVMDKRLADRKWRVRIRSPTWPASAGRNCGNGRDRRSTSSRTSNAGWRGCWRARPCSVALASAWKRPAKWT